MSKNPVALSEYYKLYELALSYEGKSPKTLIVYFSNMNRFLRFLRAKREREPLLADLDEQAIMDYVASLKQGSPNGRYAAVNVAQHLTRWVPRYHEMYTRVKGRKPPRKGHFIALVAVARDFVSNVLYDMWHNRRPFFAEVKDYRSYRQKHSHSND